MCGANVVQGEQAGLDTHCACKCSFSTNTAWFTKQLNLSRSCLLSEGTDL